MMLQAQVAAASLDLPTCLLTAASLATGFLLGVVGKAIEHRFFSKSVGEDTAFQFYQDKYFELLAAFQRLYGEAVAEALAANHLRAACAVLSGDLKLEDMPEALAKFAKREMESVDSGQPDSGLTELRVLAQQADDAFDEAADRLRKLAFEYDIYLPKAVAERLWDYYGTLENFQQSDLLSRVDATLAIQDAHDVAIDSVLRQLADVNGRRKSVSQLICRA